MKRTITTITDHDDDTLRVDALVSAGLVELVNDEAGVQACVALSRKQIKKLRKALKKARKAVQA